VRDRSRPLAALLSRAGFVGSDRDADEEGRLDHATSLRAGQQACYRFPAELAAAAAAQADACI